MEIIYSLMLVGLVLSLGAFALWMGVTAHNAGQYADAETAKGVEEEFTPFDLSQLRDLPNGPDRAAVTTGDHGRKQSAATAPSVFPPAVPFNYPNS
jgi:hypothetical protein